MQYGHYHFQRTFLFFLVHVRRNSASVIQHTNAVVFQNTYKYISAVTGQGLVYTVVDYFINQMVKAFGPYISNIHGRALAHCL